MVTNALGIIDKSRPSLLAELKCLIDEYHQWQKPLSYYDIVAGDWLEHFSHLTLNAIFEVEAENIAETQNKPIPVSADIFAFDTLRLHSSRLHDHLKNTVSGLLSGVMPDSRKFAVSSSSISSSGNRQLVEGALRISATDKPQVMIVAPYFKCSKAESAATLFSWRGWAVLDNLEYPINFNVDLDSEWRLQRSADTKAGNDLMSILRMLLPLYLPVALLEGFLAYRKIVLSMNQFRPRMIYSANALHGNLKFKILAAEWKEEGTVVAYHQHGGGYGIDKAHAIEEYEKRVSDHYYTWGWRSEDNSKVRPLTPSALHAPTQKRKYILLNCVDFPDVVYRIHYHPMPGLVDDMRRETCRFLSEIKRGKELLVRPYGVDYSGRFIQMMIDARADAAFDNRRASSFERFAQSRVVVHNYLGTSYLETLALNIPTVCFYNPDSYAFRNEAQPYMNDLERVGILHDSGESAAKFLNEIAEDPKGWWGQDDVQNVRTRFVERYANFTSEWSSQWKQEFRRAIDESEVVAK